MINSIEKIIGIGRYNDFESTVKLNKNQVIFGFNGSGKSTLSDIFYSMSNTDRFRTLSERKTIELDDGTVSKNPEVVLTADGPRDLIYKDGTWNHTENVYVFNERFIDEYMLIGENYTTQGQAIHFGKEETKLAGEIKRIEEENKELLSSINEVIINNKRVCERLSLGKTRISENKWQKRVTDISKLELYSNVAKSKLEHEIQLASSQDERIQKMRKWEGLINSSPVLHETEKVQSIKSLKKVLESVPRVSAQEIEEHTLKYMKRSDLNWLIAGMGNQKDPRLCPFCGQEILNDEHKILMKKIERFVNSRYQKKSKEISRQMRVISRFFDEGVLEVYLFNLQAVFEENEVNPLLSKSTVNILKSLFIVDEGIDVDANNFVVIRKKIFEKEKNPFIPITLTAEESAILKLVIRILQRTEKLRELFYKDKQKLEAKIQNEKVIARKMALFEASYSDNRDSFIKMIQNAKKILANDKAIRDKQEIIDDLVNSERGNAVNRFLEELNVNFKIVVKNNKSYVQIIGYKPEEFNKRDQTLCSEGETRILALAYFLSEVDKAEGERIIIIDDPISSLDLNRKSVVAMKLVGLMEKQNTQMIVLSHDISFIEKIDALKKNPKPDYLYLKKNGENPFSQLIIHDFLLSEEEAYKEIIKDGENSISISDRIIALMAMRPYAYVKSIGIDGAEMKYDEIVKRSTYFAHSTYSRNKSIKFEKRYYSARGLRVYCKKVNRLGKVISNIDAMIPDDYSYTALDVESAWQLYSAFGTETMKSLRKKALALRLVLETSLYALVDKRSFDPENIGQEYNKAEKKAVIKTRDKKLREKNEMIIQLHKLYDFAKKYHHGAEAGSTLGISMLNPDEMRQFDRIIIEIHKWIVDNPERCNKYLLY